MAFDPGSASKVDPARSALSCSGVSPIFLPLGSRLDAEWGQISMPVHTVQDLSDLRRQLTSFYRHTGRSSIDPELMIRLLLVGYC